MERIQTTYIEEEMEQSYIDYAISVISGRAIPDVRDGSSQYSTASFMACGNWASPRAARTENAPACGN